MQKQVVFLLAAFVALAGCFGSDEDPETDSTPDGQGNGGASEDNFTNAPPTVDFSANRTDGAAPLDVRFDFNASDADGDDLTWTLDVDGDGKADAEGAALPGNYTHRFETAGSFNATLNVTDGTNNTVASVAINVAGAAEEPDEEPSEEPPEFEDRGDYTYEYATGMCHWKEFEGAGVYVFDGTWFAAEANLVDGLQVANNHPGGPAFNHPGVADDCQDGDQLLF